LIADAVRENDFAGFANDKIVEEMLAGIGEGVAAKECAVGTEVNERGIAAIFGGVGPMVESRGSRRIPRTGKRWSRLAGTKSEA